MDIKDSVQIQNDIDPTASIESTDPLSHTKDINHEKKPHYVQDVVVCPRCSLKLTTHILQNDVNAHCPQCDSQLYRGKEFSLPTNLMLAISGLLFFIPTIFLPFITIRLININFSSTIISGALALFNEGFPILGLLIFLCSAIFPLLLFLSIIGAHWGLNQRHFKVFKYALITYQHIKNWWMLDVFLLSIAVSAFKLQEYSTITPKVGLICLVLTQIIAITLIVRISVRRYWETWESASDFSEQSIEVHCQHCHLSQPYTKQCQRCLSSIIHHNHRSIQITWAFLLAAAILLIPANVLNISVIFSNGIRYEDTIFSGVVTLMDGQIPIAIIIFVASILVPVAKIVVLAYILICIQLKSSVDQYHKMKLYLFVKWIGKWSILDLFVIATTIALVDRDQILDFSPGPAAIAFAAVVILTMFAAESLDPRLIWDTSTKTDHKNESYEK